MNNNLSNVGLLLSYDRSVPCLLKPLKCQPLKTSEMLEKKRPETENVPDPIRESTSAG
jgi:hypothetical protein